MTWFYIYIVVIIIVFVYHLFFWDYNITQLFKSNKKRQIYNILDNCNSTDEASTTEYLYNQILNLFANRSGKIDMRIMYDSLCNLYKKSLRKKESKADIIFRILEYFKQENPYIFLSPSTAKVLNDLKSDIEKSNVNNALKNHSVLVSEFQQLKEEQNKSIKQFWIGLILTIISMVPMIQDVIDIFLT